jgi:hypothetical protein
MKNISSTRAMAKTRRKHNSKPKTRKRVCSPIANHNKIDENTCLTPNILTVIKTEFNKLNPNDAIIAKTSKGIWLELQKKCDCVNTTDECWYSHIKDNALREKITKYIYAPTHPKSWNKNPNEWLSNFDILKVLKQYETTYSNFKFFEPTTIDFDLKLSQNQCVSDEICNIDITRFIKPGKEQKTEFGFIFNLDSHTGSGTHWVSFYISFKYKFAFYFDSVGEPIPNEVKRLKNRIVGQMIAYRPNTVIKFYQNAPFNHQRGNNECGMYSLYFITTMLTKKIDGVQKTLNDVIKYFKGKNGAITDSKMNSMRLSLFNRPS